MTVAAEQREHVGHTVASIAEHRRAIGHIRAHERKSRPFQARQTRLLQTYIVIIIDPVDADHPLAAGSYGTCVVCGRPIGDERLDARPFALRCITCAR